MLENLSGMYFVNQLKHCLQNILETVHVVQVGQVGQGKPAEGMEPMSQSYLVELSVLAPSGQDAIAEDMRSFAEQLRPLVQLEKVDYKRLQHIP
jgi:hypothetical protein